METDRQMLIWFHERLVHKYGESELFDYMHRLRQIIRATDRRKTSRKGIANSLDDLKKQLHIKP